jgi:basic membrane protein A and related proteins
MSHRHRSPRHPLVLATLATSTVLALSACGGDSGGGGGGGGDDIGGRRIAAVFSGSTTDADYNALGLLALQQAEEDGAETTYSESVPVPDVERAMQEYLADGYEVIWTHGSQFYEATAKLAEENPDATFIGEFDGEPEGQPDNVWVLDRNFHIGFYAVGVLASKLSKTGTVGYVGGLSLPFSYSEVHAMEKAVADTGAATKINPVWTGDFNDPAKAQQITTQLLSQGADVIVGSLNLGAVGTFQAVQSRPPGEAWVTAKYTDKSQFGAEHYAGSVLYDFAGPLTDVLAEIQDGTTSGYYPLGFETGVEIQVPDNVPAEVKAAVDDTVAKIKDGTITVERDVSAIE